MSVENVDLAACAWTVRAERTGAFDGIPEPIREQVADGIPASVPGVVHTDLLAAGLIPDPCVDRNEAELQYIGAQTWVYSTLLTLEAGSPALAEEFIDLVCEGLDTVARITVNGTVVGHTANQHRSYRFPVHDLLHEGDNELVISFAPALEYARGVIADIGERPHVEAHPFNMIRKMACNFGWDWGPCLITAGIWKPIRLECWSHARITSATVAATTIPMAEGGLRGELDVKLELEGQLRFAAATVRITGHGCRAEVGVPAQQELVSLQVGIDDVEAWWPHTMGDQPLYDVEIVLHNDLMVLERITRRVGFRSVELDTTPDADGGGARFAIRINGRDMFARGADWIPDDVFPSRITPERYRERLEQTRDANIDFLRIWGGGIFEQDSFYDACDELGIVVWQDMLMACAAYPEEEPIRSEIEAEVRDNVVRLSPHPSLCIWNGCNENLWGFDSWGWSDQIGDQTWGAGYYYDMFPKIVAELDPSRPYWYGSPSSGHPAIHANNDNYGPVHVWDVWNQEDYTHYAQYSPRFVAEFGFQAPATWATWNHAVPESERYSDSPSMLAHEKAADGLGKLDRGLAHHLAKPADGLEGFDNWLYLTQVNQARAVAYGIEWWRSMRGRCMGTVVWQINDCWPVSSWAALDLGTDSSGRPVARRKPLWHALREVYADHLLTIQPVSRGGWELVLVNDALTDWVADAHAQLRRTDGEVVAELTHSLSVPAGSTRRVPLERLGAPAIPTSGLALVAWANDARRTVRFLTEDKDNDLPVARWSVTTEGRQVTVTAETLIRSLCLFPDRLDENSWSDTELVDLFPGESHTFTVRDTESTFHPEDLQAPVLRAVNDEANSSSPIGSH